LNFCLDKILEAFEILLSLLIVDVKLKVSVKKETIEFFTFNSASAKELQRNHIVDSRQAL